MLAKAGVAQNRLEFVESRIIIRRGVGLRRWAYLSGRKSSIVWDKVRFFILAASDRARLDLIMKWPVPISGNGVFSLVRRLRSMKAEVKAVALVS
jgi:hypothetical protein